LIRQRGEEKLREISNSTMVWWWREAWYSGRASPSSRVEEEERERQGCARG
jgi:hypothetical protein